MKEANKNTNIQILRAVAILLVVVQHLHRLPLPEWLLSTYSKASYWTGVDIFLAISGYLMCKSLESEIIKNGRGTRAFSAFFMKRVFRLVPALFFWCLICILIASLISPFYGASISKSFETFIYSMLGISNLFFYERTIANIPYDPLISVTWSLSLEWQLYIILALFSVILRKHALVFAMMAIILLSSLFLPNSVSHQETIGWWIRPQAFFLGALIYIFEDKISCVIKGPLLSFSLFLLSSFSLVYFTPIIAPQLKLFYIGLLGAIIFASLSISMSVAIRSSVLEWIGDRSYSIYLCHIPIMLLTRMLLDKYLEGSFLYQNIMLYLATFTLATAFASDLSYRFIEKKSIELYKKRYSEKPA
jgi:peptidoglycan/LPS O-acetylase OafA/YrhL